jgi:hypothetical protein
MAIVNRTPDSFFDRGATFAEDAALRAVEAAIRDGADIIDIGGVKAGPGAAVDVSEEIRRTVPTIAAVRRTFPEIVISIDTWRAEVADAAIAAGADLINDTWAGADQRLAEVAAATGATPRTGALATRAAFVTGSGATLLHVATHAESGPLGGALVFADGRLSAGEIVDRGLAAQLVVLTSCASADPRDRDELGTLASAFLAAGTHAVVASRWAVEDDVALAFARAFYAAGAMRDPLAATAAAQRRLMQDGVPVTSWATFVVIGTGPSPNHEREEDR